jgi:hypothetical protein
VNRAAYQHMLTDCIVVANLLQPGPGYGTTHRIPQPGCTGR